MPYLRYIDLISEASAPLPPSRYWEHDDSPWTPPRKPLAEATVALLPSAGVHLAGEPPFANANDTSVRLLHRRTPLADLATCHPAPINLAGKQDLNVVFPLQRFLELEAEGTIGRLAEEHPSIIGTVRLYDRVAEEMAPTILRRLREQEVDLLCCFPL